MSAPLPPSENIGPYYRFVGAVLLLAFVVIIVGLVTPLVMRGALPTDPVVVKVLAGLAVVDFFGFLLITVRPKRFDDVFRMVISALPFTKYGSVTEGAGKAE